jgi:hypothetical protein
VCEPPPIPAKLLEPCQDPEPLQSGTMAELYQQMLRDLGPWGRCIRIHDQLVEVVKYRDAVCAKFTKDAQQQQQGFKWPWQ